MMGPESPSGLPPFLDPPSYADVIFTPTPSTATTPTSGAGSAPSSDAASPRSRRAAASPYLHISVSDPQREHDAAATSLVPGAAASHLTYLVSSSIRPHSAPSAVRRRFRDVVTLADRLAEAHRGLFIPVRPDKALVDGHLIHNLDFVETRRLAIEKYLWRLALHPVIGKSDELRVFLQAQGRLPLPTSTDVASRMLDGAVRLPRQLFWEGAAAQVAPQEVVQPARGGRDLLRIFKELKQAVVTDWGGVKPMVVEEDKEFLEKKGAMQELEVQLSSASQQVGDECL